MTDQLELDLDTPPLRVERRRRSTDYESLDRKRRKPKLRNPKLVDLEQLRRGITPAIRRRILGGEEVAWCHYCGFPGYEIDHVIPVTRGGGQNLDNLVPACSECNGEKSDRTIGEWADARRAKGLPWPIPHMNARIIDLMRRDEPWPWPLHLADASSDAVYGWIAEQPGGYAALRRCVVAGRNVSAGGA